MNEARSIAVLIPSRNCAALIPGHLQSLQEWMELAEEIVVVDSHSHDGTLEMLRAGLSHPRVKFLTHPPGLYQSWNFGIQNVSAKYVYVATVGDPITRRGIQHLYDVAETFQSDVVISKPGFINESGQPLPDDRWPIDVILARLRIRQPQLLATAEQFVFAVTNTWGAILGSSASNLYRTDFLKPRPFPTEYGTAGDGGWGIEHIFEVKIAVTPERFSSFRQHRKGLFALGLPCRVAGFQTVRARPRRGRAAKEGQSRHRVHFNQSLLDGTGKVAGHGASGAIQTGSVPPRQAAVVP